MTLKKRLYTAAETAAAIDRMAAAIVEDCRAAREEDFALVGLYQQGVPLAERLCAAIETLSGRRPPMAMLDISLYRDDFGKRSALPLIREITAVPASSGSRCWSTGAARSSRSAPTMSDSPAIPRRTTRLRSVSTMTIRRRAAFMKSSGSNETIQNQESPYGMDQKRSAQSV